MSTKRSVAKKKKPIKVTIHASLLKPACVPDVPVKTVNLAVIGTAGESIVTVPVPPTMARRLWNYVKDVAKG